MLWPWVSFTSQVGPKYSYHLLLKSCMGWEGYSVRRTGLLALLCKLVHFSYLCLLSKGWRARPERTNWVLPLDLVKQNYWGLVWGQRLLSMGSSLGPQGHWEHSSFPVLCVASVSCAVGGAHSLVQFPPPRPTAVAVVAQPHLLPNSLPMGVVKGKSQEVRRPHTSNMLGGNSIPMDCLL